MTQARKYATERPFPTAVTAAKGILSLGSLALGLCAGAADARADEPQAPCPPGSWFCGETTQPPAPAPAPKEDEPAAPAEAPKPEPPTPPPHRHPPPLPPPPPPPAPPVVYEPIPPPVAEAPPPYPGHGRPRAPEREWGLNFGFNGSMLGGGAVKGAGMGGPSVNLRYRPMPHFALQGGVAFMGGRDYVGAARNETSIAGSVLLFLNPHDKFQLYVLGGVGWSVAAVGADFAGNPGPGYDYQYVGGQLGGGAEWRLGKHLAFYGEVRGFVRTRVDSQASYTPEFKDSSGRVTNTSGGGTFGGGLTFYF